MNTQERIQKRRAYLAKKGWGYTKVGVASLFAVPICFVAFLFLMGAVLSLFLCFFVSHTEGGVCFLGSLFCAIGSLCFGLPGFYLVRTARLAHLEATRLPYVPPVTTHTLPAEEVLVRGSEPPAQDQSQLLLRGTDGNACTGEQELLRSSQQD